MPETTLILASTSPHRRMLLERLQIPFACAAPDVDEAERLQEAPDARAVRLANAKTRAVARMHPGAIVIGSDQVASMESAGQRQILHKPGTRGRCIAQLAQMSGHVVDFHTAVAVSAPNGALHSHVDHTRVRFRRLGEAEILAYVEREPAFDCAGGFKCEGLGVTLFEAIETRDPTALIGLPLIGLCALLREAGVAV